MDKRTRLWTVVKYISSAVALAMLFITWAGNQDVFFNLPEIISKRVAWFGDLPLLGKALLSLCLVSYLIYVARSRGLLVTAEDIRTIVDARFNERVRDIESKLLALSRDVRALALHDLLPGALSKIDQTREHIEKRWIELDQFAHSKDVDWSNKRDDNAKINKVMMIHNLYESIQSQADSQFGYNWAAPPLDREYVPDELPHIPEDNPFKKLYKAEWIDAQKQQFYLSHFRAYVERLTVDARERVWRLAR